MSDEYEEADFDEEDFQEAPEATGLRKYDEIVFCPHDGAYMPFRTHGAIVRRHCGTCGRYFEGSLEVSADEVAATAAAEAAESAPASEKKRAADRARAEVDAARPKKKAPAKKKAASPASEAKKAPAKKSSKKETAPKAKKTAKKAKKSSSGTKSASKGKKAKKATKRASTKRSNKTAAPTKQVGVQDRCAAVTASGTPCRNKPRGRSKYCASHKGWRPPRA